MQETQQIPGSSSKFLFYYEKFMLLIGLSGQGFFYLQAYEIYQKKSSGSVSLKGFLLSLFCLTCWLIYGFLKRDKVLIIVNAVAVLSASLTVAVIIIFS